MNITRVERDGVEFFTIDATGESGMSESGLARLCGVAQQSMNTFVKSLRNLPTVTNEKIALNPALDGNIWLQARGLNTIEKTQIRNLAIVRADACATVIEHYAFHSKYKTPEALFAFQKFARSGITGWIQEATHWHGNAVPKNGIVLDYNTIETLLENKLDATAYRVYLVLQKAIRMRVQLSALEIMEQAKISRSGYSSAIGKLADADLLPEWCSIKRKRHPERDVRDRLQAELGGQVEAYTRYGLIDLLTATELIEIKTVDRWKDAVGHILAKAHRYPNHAKRLHLFSSEEPILETIEQVCTPHNIRVTYEKVDRPKLNSSASKLT